MKLGAFETCVYCPKLCRHVCPVAVGSSREAATPTAMMTVTWLGIGGRLGDDATAARTLAAEAATLCVDCGACTAACLVARPVGSLLASARAALLPAGPIEPLGPIEGPGELVAIESDPRGWARHLAHRLGTPVARLRTRDFLGAAALDHAGAFGDHATSLRALLGERTAVVTEHASLRAATTARIAVRHLVELIDWRPAGPVHHPCAGPRLPGPTAPDALSCCGARSPLVDAHPDVAGEVAADAWRRLGGASIASPDTRCAAALRGSGGVVIDVVDALLSDGVRS